MVALASFTTYVFVDEKNVLDASKTFVSLALFNIMRNPLQNLPLIISNLLQMFVSVKRINNFLNAEEISPDTVQHEKNIEYPVSIVNGTFSWDEYPILKDINLKLKHRTLTAVVGSVGAGKSSLLYAILGEMEKISGNVNRYGKVAYVPQQAWIQNATLKDNILFGRTYNRKRYDEVIDICALKTDFEILPAGDRTEIGEKGINLSGGQKQRISLARAVYADADVYLLDDPLSAVDSHVGKHIFDHVIGPKGYLRHKTKFFITHAITYLPQVHQIVVMKDGYISEIGNFHELLNRKGDFAEFLKQHVDSECDVEIEVPNERFNENPNRLSSRLSQNSSWWSEGQISDLQSNGSIVSNRKVSLKEKLESKIGQNLIEKEKAEVGKVKWYIYNYYLKNIGFKMILIIFGIQVFSQGFEIASNAWLGRWSEDDTIVVNGIANPAKRNMYLGVYGAVGFGQAVTVISYNIIYAIATLSAASKIHKCLLESTLRLPMHFFDTTPIGRILSRFSTDLNGVDATLPSTFHNVITNILKLCEALLVITYTTPVFISVMIPLFGVYYGIQRVYIATSRQLRRLVSISSSPLFSHFGESLTGLQTIRAYNQQKRFTLECHQKIDISQSGQFSHMTSNRWLSIRLELIGNLIIFFAALFAALAKNQSPALVGLSVSYSLQIIFTFTRVVNMVSSVETNIVSVERIKEYQDSEKEAAWEKRDNTSKYWPESGRLEFQNFGVRYREGLDLVLRNVNVHIKAGSKVGVVGRTGAGKSSMTLGLFRLIEAAEGKIEIDGVNIAELGLQKLRSALTIIPQDPVLFAGTLRVNLDPFNNHSDEELWRTLELAHFKHFLDGLPEGLQHEITEGGQNLSAGQKQLLCLARALLRKTKILILDEATAAIDLETDDLLQQTIRKELRIDRIIVLDKGTIVEYDSPLNLIANKQSIFHGMCKDAGLC